MIAPVLLAAITATVPPKLDGITVGQNVAAVIKAREIPVDRENPVVRNTDAGHVWTWTQKDGTLERLTTDDDGIVQMIDILASPANRQWITVPVSGSLQFNESGHINAQGDGPYPDLFRDEWLPLANRAGTVLGYGIQPDYGVLFAFPAPGDQGMIEVLTGTREALFGTGMVPNETPALQPAMINRNVYKAPNMMPSAGRGFVRDFMVYVRIAVGSDGIPTAATVFARSGGPTGTGGSNLDNAAVYATLREKFQPATVNGKPVPSIYFQYGYF